MVTKAKKFLKYRKTKRDEYRSGTFNKVAVFITKNFTDRYLIKTQTRGIFALPIFTLIITIFLFCLFWLNGFAAKGSIS
eukprot:Pgem_evm1s17090